MIIVITIVRIRIAIRLDLIRLVVIEVHLFARSGGVLFARLPFFAAAFTATTTASAAPTASLAGGPGRLIVFTAVGSLARVAVAKLFLIDDLRCNEFEFVELAALSIDGSSRDIRIEAEIVKTLVEIVIVGGFALRC
jgi:hypothetical protein